MKNKFIILLMLLFPFNVLAYSDYIIPGGDTIGINVQNNGILVVGFYRVNGNLNNNKLKIGDTILKVNGENASSIEEFTSLIEKNIVNNKVLFTIKRNNEIFDKEIELYKKDGVYKTGLYVKSGVIGIGTLSYVDPETMIYGALGHQISNWRS